MIKRYSLRCAAADERAPLDAATAHTQRTLKKSHNDRPPNARADLVDKRFKQQPDKIEPQVVGGRLLSDGRARLVYLGSPRAAGYRN